MCRQCDECVVFQTEYSQREGSHFIYRIERSPMCEYLVNFIHKLKHLPKKYMMNSVLENFTILQVSNNCLSVSPVTVILFYLFYDLAG